jgi:hypothetical protein
MLENLSVVEVLGAMITPAVLISASGTLVLSTSNRLNRVVDRVRVIAAQAEKLHQEAPQQDPAGFEARKALVRMYLVTLSARALLLRSAMTALYLAIGILVTTSIAVGIDATLHWRYSWVPVLLGLTGTGVLLYGSFLLVREARLAVDSLMQETASAREAVEKS